MQQQVAHHCNRGRHLLQHFRPYRGRECHRVTFCALLLRCLGASKQIRHCGSGVVGCGSAGGGHCGPSIGYFRQSVIAPAHSVLCRGRGAPRKGGVSRGGAWAGAWAGPNRLTLSLSLSGGHAIVHGGRALCPRAVVGSRLRRLRGVGAISVPQRPSNFCLAARGRARQGQADGCVLLPRAAGGRRRQPRWVCRPRAVNATGAPACLAGAARRKRAPGICSLLGTRAL